MASPFDAVAFENPFDSVGVNSFNALIPRKEERGFVRTLVDETVADFVGAGKVAAALALSPFEAFGAEVPISFDDISRRDVAGAGAIAAMVLTGGAYKALQGARIGATALSRAATTAGVEAAGGALYGALSAEEGENVIDNMVQNAVTFGALGAGASSLKSAYKATIGNFAAGLKAANARTQFAEAAQRFQVESQAREFAGIKLFNPENSARIGIRRNAQNEIAATIYDPQGKGDTIKFADFNEALTFARSEGFVEDLGVFRSKPIKALDSLSEEMGALARENPEGIAGVVGRLELEDYRAWKQASADLADADAHLTASALEVAMPSNEWGAPTFGSDSTRQQAARAAGILPAQAAKLSDTELLREMVLRGAVTPETLQAGVAQQDLLRELFVNGLVPEAHVIMTSPVNDSLFTSFLTARTLAKIHPEISPFVKDMTDRRHSLDLSMSAMQERLFKLRTAVPKAKANRAVEIIDASAEAGDIATARASALEAARATGDDQIVHFVEEAQSILGDYLQRFQDAGIVADGLAGYFPIKNVGQWKVEITRGGKAEFQGFHKSKADALRKLDELRAADESITSARLVPNRITFDPSASTVATMEPRQFAALTKAIRAATEEEITWKEAGELAREVARPSAGPLKSMGNLKQRKLGIRDFSLDPYEALGTYAAGAERVLAFRDFERNAAQIVESINPDKKALRRWVEQMTDDVLGRPRRSEEAVQNVLEWLSEASGGKIPVAPRALAQYTAALRKWTSFSRLGGFFSAAVNLTQISTNAYAKLGAKWTGKGLEALISRKKWNEVTRLISESNVDLDLFGSLVETGEGALHDTIRGALKEQRYVEAAFRTSLFAFKGTEKINRVVTWWGAYNKALAEGQSKDLAVAYASDIMRTTQFDMHLTNNPEILRGPLGQTIGQFKSFIINEIEFIGSLNQRELARFGAGLWASGGLAVMFNMPGTDLVDAASGMFTDQKLSERLKVAPDSTLAKTAVFGLPGLFNTDLSDHVGVGSMRDITRGLIGPAPQDLARLFTFMRDAAVDVGAEGRVNPETFRTFSQQVMPSAIRRALRGADVLQTGEVRNPYSHKLVYHAPDRFWTGVRTAFGAPEIEGSQERVLDEVQVRIRERFVKARTAYAKEAGLAMREGRREEAMQILREAGARGYDIDARSLDYWTEELGKSAAERRERRTPAELRKHYASLFDATGSLSQ